MKLPATGHLTGRPLKGRGFEKRKFNTGADT